jgi:CRP-like cAMP-binding protein
MSREAKIRKLQSELSCARAVNDSRGLIECLTKLEHIAPNEPTYPHQLGDVQLKLGARTEAVNSYERAVIKYAAGGYIARAMAMAKTLLFVDPSRTDVLERLEQSPAHELRKRSHPDFQLPALLRTAEIRANKRSPSAESSAGSRSKLEVVRGQEKASSTLGATPSAASSCAENNAKPSVEADVGLSGAEFQLHHTAGLLEANETQRRRQSDEGDDPTVTAERLAMMPIFPLFSDAPREALAELVRRSELVRCEGSKRIVRVGEPAEGLYAIVEGRAKVIVPGFSRREPISLGEGDVFGEACLLSAEPRRADVFSDGHMVALYFSKSALHDLVVAFPRLQGLLLSLLARRLLANFVETSPLFQRFDAATKVKIAKAFKLGRAIAGSHFVNESQPSTALVIPLTGRVIASDLRGPHAGRERRLRPGTAFGHEALLGQTTLPYQAQADTDLIYLRLDASHYSEIVREFPPFREGLAALPIAATRSVA